MSGQLIHVSSLCRALPARNSEFSRVREAINRNQGRMMAVVHPWFSDLHIYDQESPPSGIIRRIGKAVSELYREENLYDSIRIDIPRPVYLNYCDRVRTRLETLDWPLLILIGRGDEAATRARLSSIKLRSRLAIEVPTRKNDPEPDWPDEPDSATAWSRLTEAVSRLGVFKLWVMGELGYVNGKQKRAGCVFGAMELLDQRGITVRTDPELIFPGTDWCSGD
ncbi:MAG: hypothetical protein WC632_06865 [Candidatus Margulisiibacteriota bacterium]